MAEYILLTTGHGRMPEGEQEMTSFMDAWGAWANGLGTALKDGGKPIRTAKTIDPSGSVRDGSSVDASGYCIITADSMDDAVEKAKGCPALDTGNSISIFETASMGGD